MHPEGVAAPTAVCASVPQLIRLLATNIQAAAQSHKEARGETSEAVSARAVCNTVDEDSAWADCWGDVAPIQVGVQLGAICASSSLVTFGDRVNAGILCSEALKGHRETVGCLERRAHDVLLNLAAVRT